MATGASGKKARVEITYDEDRLSALPDVLIHAILSFVKARQVVQTSVLSKRWRHLWRSVPCLRIDTREFKGTHGGWLDDGPRFMYFTNTLLMERNGSLLDTFELYVDEEELMSSDRWILLGIKRFSPRVLSIRHHGDNTIMPSMPLALETGSSLCRLTKLHLFSIFVGSCFVELLSNVALEVLELKQCLLGCNTIASLSLRNLVIDGGGWTVQEFGDHGDLTIKGHGDLTIKAPQLVSLHLNITALVFEISVTEMLSLVNASIYINNVQRISHNIFRQFLSNLHNATNIVLSGFYNMGAPDGPFEFPEFKNLRTLLLDDSEPGDKFEMLRHLLKKSHNLETLTVRTCKISKDPNRWEGKAEEPMSLERRLQLQRMNFERPELKLVNIVYEDGDDVGQLVNSVLDISGSCGITTNTITIKKSTFSVPLRSHVSESDSDSDYYSE